MEAPSEVGRRRWAGLDESGTWTRPTPRRLRTHWESSSAPRRHFLWRRPARRSSWARPRSTRSLGAIDASQQEAQFAFQVPARQAGIRRRPRTNVARAPVARQRASGQKAKNGPRKCFLASLRRRMDKKQNVRTVKGCRPSRLQCSHVETLRRKKTPLRIALQPPALVLMAW